MKKQILILTTALLLLGAQPAVHAHSWWATVTSWFNEKPALAISATALTVVAIGWCLYKKVYKTTRKIDAQTQTEVASVDAQTQTGENQTRPIDEIKRPEWVDVSSECLIKKATSILQGVEDVSSLVGETLSDKKEAYLVGLEIKKQAEKLLAEQSRMFTGHNLTKLQKALKVINSTSKADYLKGADKHYRFQVAIDEIVDIVKPLVALD
jgi:hypothetical protein